MMDDAPTPSAHRSAADTGMSSLPCRRIDDHRLPGAHAKEHQSRLAARAPERHRAALGLVALEHEHHLLGPIQARSEEHTSELQSQSNLVCRLLLEKKKRLMKTSLGNRCVKLLQRRKEKHLKRTICG